VADGLCRIPRRIVPILRRGLYRTAIAYAKLDGPNQVIVLGAEEVLDARAAGATLTFATSTGGELRLSIRSSSRISER